MIQAKIINKINFPEINLQSTLEEIANEVIIPDIVRGIDAGMAINGGSLPENEPATIKHKGHSRQLIDTGELRNSFFYKTQGKNKVVISIESGRKNIGGYLQNDGVGKKNKHYRFFGISKDAYNKAMTYTNNKIKELTKSGNKGK